MPETGLSPAEKYLCSAYGAHISWANTENRTERTAPARKAFEERFEREVRESDPMGSYPRLRSPSVPNLSGKLISRSWCSTRRRPAASGVLRDTTRKPPRRLDRSGFQNPRQRMHEVYIA